jgi:hypothetical protein
MQTRPLPGTEPDGKLARHTPHQLEHRSTKDKATDIKESDGSLARYYLRKDKLGKEKMVPAMLLRSREGAIYYPVDIARYHGR